MDETPSWYLQAKYEQAWENYRNEDENYRATVWQYLVFASALIYAATQAKPATTKIGLLGLMVSVSTLLFIARITRYSWRWLIAKDAAIGPDTARDEIGHLTAAEQAMAPSLRLLSHAPGYLTMAAIPAVGAVFFIMMTVYGSALWD